MHKEVNEKISQLVDDELDYNETFNLLKNIKSDQQIKNKLNRYQLIGQALKNEQCLLMKHDFSEQISQKIQQEPTYFLPQNKPKNHNKIFAIAASLIAVAVLVGQTYRNSGVTNGYQTLAASTVSQQQFPGTKGDKASKQANQPLNAQFNAYLQAHNSSVYTNGEANFHPYAKVASFGQD